MVICNNCHTENPDGNKFCVKCGSPLIPNNPTGNPVNRPINPGVDPGPVRPTPAHQAPHQQRPNGGVPVNNTRQQPYQPSNRPYGPTRAKRQPEIRHPRGEKRNFVPILVAILSLAVIAGAIIFWLYRDSIFEPKAKRFVEDTESVEDLKRSRGTTNANDSAMVTNVISPTDVVYLSGKIDGKYAVHMVLDLGRRVAVYYYDKYGSSNTLTLEVARQRDLGNGKRSITLIQEADTLGNQDKWQGVLTSEKFIGSGNYLNKEMPFDLNVNSTASADFEDPLIQKNKIKGGNWETCVFNGEVTGGGKVFKVKITAQTNQGREFKDATYHNLSYNVSFPVNVSLYNDNLSITGKSGNSDFSIEATRYGREFEGYMYADGKSLPITLDLLLSMGVPE